MKRSFQNPLTVRRTVVCPTVTVVLPASILDIVDTLCGGTVDRQKKYATGRSTWVRALIYAELRRRGYDPEKLAMLPGQEIRPSGHTAAQELRLESRRCRERIRQIYDQFVIKEPNELFLKMLPEQLAREANLVRGWFKTEKVTGHCYLKGWSLCKKVRLEPPQLKTFQPFDPNMTTLTVCKRCLQIAASMRG